MGLSPSPQREKSTPHDQSPTPMTYLANLTLRLTAAVAGLPEDVRTRHAAYLAGAQNDDGGFAGRKGSSDLYYTSFGLRALAMLGTLDDPTAVRAAEFLRRQLQPKLPSIDFLSLVISAVLCAMVGAFAGNFQKHVEPDEYLAIHLSVEFVLIAVIGGLGTVPGPVVGGIVLTYLKRSLFRDLFGQANLLIFGLLLVLVILFMPEGLWGLMRMGRGWIRDRFALSVKEADHAAA